MFWHYMPHAHAMKYLKHLNRRYICIGTKTLKRVHSSDARKVPPLVQLRETRTGDRHSSAQIILGIMQDKRYSFNTARCKSAVDKAAINLLSMPSTHAKRPFNLPVQPSSQYFKDICEHTITA